MPNKKDKILHQLVDLISERLGDNYLIFKCKKIEIS